MGPIRKRWGANLPHWTADDATYFVTFRLGDSLPAEVVQRYRAERARLVAACEEKSPVLTTGDWLRLQELFESKIETFLDAGAGACWMKHETVAAMLQDSLLFFHGKRYVLHAWAVMPNHVHAMVQPLGDISLAEVLHSWKSYTSKEVNKMVGKRGELWQGESWDHLVRDREDFLRCEKYTLENPVRAGLKGWRWVGRVAET